MKDMVVFSLVWVAFVFYHQKGNYTSIFVLSPTKKFLISITRNSVNYKNFI